VSFHVNQVDEKVALNTLPVGRSFLMRFGGGALILFSANFTLPVFVLDG